MGVPLNHSLYVRIFPCKPSILGYPHLWKHHETPIFPSLQWESSLAISAI